MRKNMTIPDNDNRSDPDWALALGAIHAAGREIASSLDLDQTLRVVMQKAVETLPMDAGALFIRDEAARIYRVVVSHNLPADQVDKIRFGFEEEGVPGWAVTHRRSLVIADARQDERVHPVVVGAGILSVLAVPLISRGRVLGVLNLFSHRRTGMFDETARRLAEVFADQAALFLDNVRLMEALRAAAAVLEERVQERTRQLKEKQAQVIEAEKRAAAGRLAAAVAHEVNNPLQAIALHLQLLETEPLSADGRHLLAVVQTEFDRIGTIIGRLLDFQRPWPHLRQPVSVAPLLEAVCALTRQQMSQAGIALHTSLPPTLPPVMAAGDQLKQLFLNLILNAIEAMPTGGRLHITAWQEDAERVCLRFRDSGSGIAPEVASQLFEPFVTTKPRGSGLGLTVSRDIVQAHGGTLTVVSQPGQGTEFTVRLPLQGENDT
jgi:signal transduction histidine kinase